MVEFGGWEMPLMYPDGIIREHLNTRRGAGLFDVSHMGRFLVRGKDALAFLQHVLTNNAAALALYSKCGQNVGAQYTLIPTETGGAIDDAYLYRFQDDEFLLIITDLGECIIHWMFLALSLMVELKNLTIRKRGPIKFQKINPLPA